MFSNRALSALLAATFCSAAPASKAEDVTVTTTTTIFACGKLFDIQANAAGLTAEQRAAIVQKNLDNALIAARNRTPETVQVAMMRDNPVVVFDGYYIVTADGNSAARSGMTQTQLAQKWADSLRHCLADKEAVTKYLSMLTGQFSKTSFGNEGIAREEVAVAPYGMSFPIQLSQSLRARTARLGEAVEAVIRTDVPFGPDYSTYLPAGTKAIGELVYAKDYAPNHYGGRGALTPHFYSLRTPDQKDIPIDAYIVGDINLWKDIKTEPVKTVCIDATPAFGKDMRQENLPVEPVAGKMTGAWRGHALYGELLGFAGEPQYRTNNLQYNGLIIPNRSRGVIPAGSQMVLRLASTSSIAVVSQGREQL
jgi:hypothetical protein